MKPVATAFLILFLTACSQSEKDRAREQARQSGEQLKHDSRQALHGAERDVAKASKELDQGLEKAREKTRDALNVHPDDTRREHGRDDNDTR